MMISKRYIPSYVVAAAFFTAALGYNSVAYGGSHSDPGSKGAGGETSESASSNGACFGLGTAAQAAASGLETAATKSEASEGVVPSVIVFLNGDYEELSPSDEAQLIASGELISSEE